MSKSFQCGTIALLRNEAKGASAMCIIVVIAISVSFAWLLQAICGLVVPLTSPPPSEVVKAALGLTLRRPRKSLIDWRSRFHYWPFVTACKRVVDYNHLRRFEFYAKLLECKEEVVSSRYPELLTKLHQIGEAKISRVQAELESGQLQAWLFTLCVLAAGTLYEYLGYWESQLPGMSGDQFLILVGVTWLLGLLPQVAAFIMLRARRRLTLFELEALITLHDRMQAKVANEIVRLQQVMDGGLVDGQTPTSTE